MIASAMETHAVKNTLPIDSALSDPKSSLSPSSAKAAQNVRCMVPHTRRSRPALRDTG